MSTARTGDAWWITDATFDDISDPSLSIWDFMKAIIPAIEPAVPSRGGKIIDVGCGYGRITREVKRWFGHSTLVCGYDINPKFLAKAEEYSGYNTKGYAESPTNYPFYYNIGYDAVGELPPSNAAICVQLLQHIPYQQKKVLIDNVAKNLKPGGVFIFQYVEGNHSDDKFLSTFATVADFERWCKAAGLKVQTVAKNLICPNWTWIRAVKP